MPPSVAVVGVGMMGAPMARRLLSSGLSTTICDTNPDVIAQFAAAGAKTTSVAADCASSDVILIIVADDDQVHRAVSGVDGLRSGLRAGHTPTIVIMSTVSPSTVKSIAAQLAEVGATVMDAPISGGEPAAEAGTLTILAGGEPDVLTRVSPVLDLLGRTYRCGPVGAGVSTKIVNNLLAVVNAHVSAEAYRLAIGHELSLGVTGQVIDASSGRNFTSGPPGPADVYDRWTRTRPHFDSLSSTMRKDLRLAAALAEDTAGDFPMITALAAVIGDLDGDLYADWRAIAEAGS